MEHRIQPRILMRDITNRARLTPQDRQQAIARARREAGPAHAAEIAARFDHGSRLLSLLGGDDLTAAQDETRAEDRRIREQGARQRSERQSEAAQASKAARGMDGRPVDSPDTAGQVEALGLRGAPRGTVGSA